MQPFGRHVRPTFFSFFCIIEDKKQHTVLLWATQLALCGCVHLLLSSPQVLSKDSGDCKEIGLLPVFIFMFELSVEWPLRVPCQLKSLNSLVEHNAIECFFFSVNKNFLLSIKIYIFLILTQQLLTQLTQKQSSHFAFYEYMKLFQVT